MGGRFGCAVLAVAAVLLAGLGVTWVVKARAVQERAACANHLRQLGQFADHYARLHPERPLFNDEKGRPALTAEERDRLLRQGAGPDSVPPGTVVNPALPPDRRLSWVAELLPLLGRQPLAEGIDRSAAWDDPRHQTVARARLPVLLCPGRPAFTPPDAAALTQYVGNGGVGADAPSVAWPGVNRPHPRAGAFRYNAATPFEAFRDGLSGSVLFAETDADPGPWLRGGPATVRTLDGPAAPIGLGGQFGGLHPGGGNVAFADHSVRFLSDRTSPAVLHALFTIAGGTDDPVPGD